MREAIAKEKMLAHLFQFSPADLATPVARESVTKWLDEGITVDLTHLDFCEAFDSVNNRLHLASLREHDTRPTEINWVKSFPG